MFANARKSGAVSRKSIESMCSSYQGHIHAETVMPLDSCDDYMYLQRPSSHNLDLIEENDL
jgi:hypothetical protein